MAVSRISAISGATAATDAHALAQVWNPSATKRIYLKEFSLSAITAPAAAAGLRLRRSTARGTAGSTATPTLDNSDERDAVPDSGWLLDLAVFSVQPTLAAALLGPGWVLSAVIGSGLVYVSSNPRGICIPPGTGLVIVTRAAIILPSSEVGVVVDD